MGAAAFCVPHDPGILVSHPATHPPSSRSFTSNRKHFSAIDYQPYSFHANLPACFHRRRGRVLAGTHSEPGGHQLGPGGGGGAAARCHAGAACGALAVLHRSQAIKGGGSGSFLCQHGSLSRLAGTSVLLALPLHPAQALAPDLALHPRMPAPLAPPHRTSTALARRQQRSMAPVCRRVRASPASCVWQMPWWRRGRCEGGQGRFSCQWH